MSPTYVSRSAAPRWGLSARGSPSWSARRRAPTKLAITRPRRPSPAASRWCAPDRAGSKKPTRPPRPSVAGMDLTLSHCFVTVHDPEEALTLYPHALGLEL